MARDPQLTSTWSWLAEGIATRLDLVTHRSPTLKTVVERGARYVFIDAERREIVFDLRALFLGFLFAGRQDPNSIRYGNTASWFVTWLEQRTSIEAVSDAISRAGMVGPDQVDTARTAEFNIVLSSSVGKLIPVANDFCRRTIKKTQFEARHLFAAMIVNGVISDQVRLLFKRSLTAGDINELKQLLVARIMETPNRGDTYKAWNAILGLPATWKPSTSSISDTPVTSASDLHSDPAAALAQDGVTDFRADTVPAEGDDVLDTTRDARAIARLMCLEDVAPMAVAIFGGWGSGKSTFMAQLDRQVRVIAANIARAPADPTAARFVGKVVQMRFNAWQFVDANLWASLTAEFFDQLRAGGWDRAGDARHAWLVERVNGHVHSLSSEAEVTRQAVIDGNKEVLAAQKARDDAAVQVRVAGNKVLGRAVVDLLGETYEAQKGNLSALGIAMAGVDSDDAVDSIVGIVRDSSSIGGQLRQVGKMLAKSRSRLGTVIGGTAIGIVAGGYAWYYGISLTRDNIVGAFVALGALGTACKAAAPAVRMVRDVTTRSGTIARSVLDADEAALKDLLSKEIRLRDAATEASARQAAADCASRRLARYVDPAAPANPPRLLRYVLEDDPDTKALAAEVGLIGRTRRLFQAVDDIVRAERNKPVADRVDGDIPERIILYIDDLDRCTEEQVYAVLQATQLLLAFELFVVVVGVDVRWVQNALAKTRGAAEKSDPPAGPDDTGLRQYAASYLDKIFQVAFWLNPLDSSGADERNLRPLHSRTDPAPRPARGATDRARRRCPRFVAGCRTGRHRAGRTGGRRRPGTGTDARQRAGQRRRA